MLEIFAAKERLDLSEDIEINMTWENPFLLQDRIPAPYSLSFDLPATTKNLRIFGNPHRITSRGNWAEIESNLRFDAINFAEGVLVLTSYIKKLTVNFIGSKLPDAAKDNMSSLSLQQYDYGLGEHSEHTRVEQSNLGVGDDLTPLMIEIWASNYVNSILSNVLLADKFAACPIKIPTEEWIEYWASDDNQFRLNQKHNQEVLNKVNIVDGNYYDQATDPRISSIVMPQCYVHYLFETVFGSIVNESPFKEGGIFQDLVVVSTAHDRYSQQTRWKNSGILVDNELGEGVSNYIQLESFMNDYPFNDFLKHLLKVFCCSLIPLSNGQWNIVLNKTIIANTEKEEWGEKLTGTPEITNQEGQTYACGYNTIDEETVTGDSEISSIKELTANTTFQGVYAITSTGEVYEKIIDEKEATTDPNTYTYERQGTGLESSNIDGDYDMTSDVCPLPMTITKTYNNKAGTTFLPYENNMHLSYIPELDDNMNDATIAPSIGIVRGWVNATTGALNSSDNLNNSYPFMNSFPVDLNGTDISTLSLAWEGEKGLFIQYHKEFSEYINKDKKILTGMFELSPLDLKNLNWIKKKHLKGVLFYLNQVDVTIKLRKIGLSECELIEA